MPFHQVPCVLGRALHSWDDCTHSRGRTAVATISVGSTWAIAIPAHTKAEHKSEAASRYFIVFRAQIFDLGADRVELGPSPNLIVVGTVRTDRFGVNFCQGADGYQWPEV